MLFLCYDTIYMQAVLLKFQRTLQSSLSGWCYNIKASANAVSTGPQMVGTPPFDSPWRISKMLVVHRASVWCHHTLTGFTLALNCLESLKSNVPNVEITKCLVLWNVKNVMQQTFGEMTVILIAMKFWYIERWWKITTTVFGYMMTLWVLVILAYEKKKHWVVICNPYDMCTSWSVVTSVASVETNDHHKISCTTAGSGNTSFFLPIPFISIYHMTLEWLDLTVSIQQLCSQLHHCHILPLFA